MEEHVDYRFRLLCSNITRYLYMILWQWLVHVRSYVWCFTGDVYQIIFVNGCNFMALVTSITAFTAAIDTQRLHELAAVLGAQHSEFVQTSLN